MEVMVLINAGTFASGVANRPPKFDGILFSTFEPIQGHNVQHLLGTWGQIEKFFSMAPLPHSVKPLARR